MTRLDSVLSKIYRILGTFAVLCFGSFFIKLIKSPEGALGWTVTIGILVAVTVPFAFRKRLRLILGRAYLPLKAIMCAGLAFYTLSFAFLVGYIYLSPNADVTGDTDETEVYIVFGGRVKEDGPTKTLRERLNVAAEVMRENEGALCIVTGGQGDNEPETEAACMSRYLVERGIDESRIILEDKARNTRENIRYSMELLEEMGLTAARVICISSDTHIPRIRIMCAQAGLEAEYIKSPTPSEVFLLTALVREYLSFVKMICFGG